MREDAFRRALLLLALAGVAARIAFLLLEPATGPVADERTWTNWGIELAGPRIAFSPVRTNMVFYPPLYPYFIAVLYAPFETLTAVKWAQAVVGALLVPALGRIGAAAFGPRPGLLAAAAAAVYPELVWFSVHFWSETLFAVLLWWGFDRVLAADAPAHTGVAAAAGALWGLATLARETVLYFLPVAALWLALGRPGQGTHLRALRGPPLGRAGVFLLASVLTIAPWTYRNWVRFHAFVPVSTSGGLNLWQGNARLTRQEVYDRYEAVQGRIEQYRNARRLGIEAILERQPWWLFEKIRDEMPNFWEADSQALIHIERGAYGPVGPAAAGASTVVLLAPYLAALVFFVRGIARVPLDRPRSILLLFLIYYNAIHVATHGYARYRLPALPVVLLFAAAGLVAHREKDTAYREGVAAAPLRRRLAAVGVALALAGSVAPSLELLAAKPSFGFPADDAPAEESPRP